MIVSTWLYLNTIVTSQKKTRANDAELKKKTRRHLDTCVDVGEWRKSENEYNGKGRNDEALKVICQWLILSEIN